MKKREYVKVDLKIKEVLPIIEKQLQKIYEYNKRIKNTGYYLKPVHIVVKKTISGEKKIYRYYGRYWWNVVYRGKRGGKSIIKWIYVGREKPPGIPDPPTHPLEGLVIFYHEKKDNEFYVNKGLKDKFFKALKNRSQ